MTARRRSRVVGALFLLAFVLYGGGSALLGSAPVAGALLVLANSVAVACIGVLVSPELRPRHRFAANTYVVARVFEAVLLALGVVLLLSLSPADGGERANDLAYQVAMLGLGLGSLPFCRALLVERLVPRVLAGWGLVGYAGLALGAALAALGHDVGLVLSVPGGLFEVALGVVLLVRGWADVPAGRTPSSARRKSGLPTGRRPRPAGTP